MHNRFYKGRVALNVLSHDVQNGRDVYAAAEGRIFVGMLSKSYATVAEAVRAMRAMGDAIDGAVSVGLGGGDPRQSAMVADIVKQYAGQHINQVFTGVGLTRGALAERPAWINSLVSPTGKVGWVNVATGPTSAESAQPAIVPVKTAIALVRDMGGDALKYFPMNGLATEAEYRAVADACAAEGFGLEPTGGIDPGNFEAVLSIALEAGVPKVVPHVYSSIIDGTTGLTRVTDVAALFATVRRLVDAHE